jgi:hypothetical protein
MSHQTGTIELNVKGWNHGRLAKRLHGIFSRSAVIYEPTYYPESGKWQLESNNDWFLHIVGDTATLSTRYSDDFSEKQWSALDTVVNMFVALD